VTVVTITNPGFVDGIPSGWVADTNATFTLITTDTASVSAANCGRFVNTTSRHGMVTSSITLATATQHTLSVYVKKYGGTSTDGVLLVRETTGFTDVATSSTFTYTTSWVRQELTFTSHATETGHAFYVRGVSPSADYDILVDAFQVETGASATAYVGEGGGGGTATNLLLLGVG
jgi:hypothetical protein